MHSRSPGIYTLTSDTNSSFIAGGIAACGAVTVTHGFETVKLRCAELPSTRAAMR